MDTTKEICEKNTLEIDDKIDEGTIKKRASVGIISVSLRTAVTKLISFIGSIILARLLIPEDFGIFAIVSFIVTFFGTFADVGIGASLIRKSTVRKEELTTVFTVQQILVGAFCIIIVIIAPLFGFIWKTSVSMEWLIRVMVISFFITSLGVVPTIQLERELKYNKLVLPDILRTISYTCISVFLAYLGYGVWSFVIGAIVGSAASTISLFATSPWRISVGIDKKILRELIGFGAIYQAKGVMDLLNTAIAPIVVGILVGATGLGYIKWAESIVYLPILIIYAFTRVAFSTFSRLRDNEELYRKAIEKSIRFAGYVLYPIFFIILATAPVFTRIIFGSKWMPALPVIYIETVFYTTFPIFTPSMAMFLVGSKPKVALNLTIICTIINWVTAIPLIAYFGFVGWPLAICFSCLTFKYQYDEMKKIIDFKIFRNIYPAFLSALGAGVIIYYIITLFVNMNFVTLMLTGLSGFLIYLLFLYGFEGKKLIAEIKNIYLSLTKKAVV
jgi:PST family polysaccharide transporter